MRYQKAELAFFLFILLILAATGTLYFAYQAVQDAAAPPMRAIELILAAGSLNVAAMLFGTLFIFTLIRS